MDCDRGHWCIDSFFACQQLRNKEVHQGIDFAFFVLAKTLLGCPAVSRRAFFCLAVNLAAKGGE